MIQENQIYKKINTFHQDLIHDLAFDWYGKKLATCSADKLIKIWQKNSSGQWEMLSQLQTDDGPVWKIKWAHPEFGNILAACSMDRCVYLYEEYRDITQNKDTQWRSTKLYNDKEQIEDIKFSPKSQGLQLAISYADGIIRIYQFTEMTNLSIYQEIYNVKLNNLGVNCISWNKNRFENPMIAIGCKDLENSQNKESQNIQMQQQNEDQQGYFCIYTIKEQKTFEKLKIQNCDLKTYSSPINDVSWSQINGRSFHLIAICGKEGAKILYLKSNNQNNQVNTMSIIKCIDLSQMEQSSVEVWKISWNIMGTLLALSDNNNEVKLYKCTNDNWQKIKVINEQHQNEEENYL